MTDCSLICCERKTLFRLKNKQKHKNYKTSEHDFFVGVVVDRLSDELDPSIASIDQAISPQQWSNCADRASHRRRKQHNRSMGHALRRW
jgi:hypothetical protein